MVIMMTHHLLEDPDHHDDRDLDACAENGGDCEENETNG